MKLRPSKTDRFIRSASPRSARVIESLLEWSPSSDVDRALEHRDRSDLLASYRAMGIAPAIAATMWIGLTLTHAAALLTAGPILLLWGASPAIAWWVSRPLPRRSARLTVDQTYFLRKLARRTWAYFETYVGPDDHWLPPDNMQEHPEEKVAHRTSPTNMGLALLANLTAHDFGYLSTGQLVARTANALNTMESLERHRGHFYNWYDTRTRLPLAPLYVSTVDSGNLAGHLLTLRPGLAALCDAPILNRRWLEGVSDAFSILADAVGKELSPTVAQFERALESAAAARPATLADTWVQLNRLAACAADLTAQCTAHPRANAENEAGFWVHALARQCADMRDELIFLAPWLALQTASGTRLDWPGSGGVPTLRELAAFDAPLPAFAQGAARAAARMVAIEALALQATALAPTDYDFLFDKVRRQLVIGYNVADHRCEFVGLHRKCRIRATVRTKQREMLFDNGGAQRNSGDRY